MIHYNFLKFKPGADIDAALNKCRTVYAELEKELSFLHDARVERCVTARDSNADIMMIMRIDAPEQLSAYLNHPLHVALAQGMKDEIAARISFDAQE